MLKTADADLEALKLGDDDVTTEQIPAHDVNPLKTWEANISEPMELRR